MNDPIRSLNDAELVAAVEAYAKALAEGHWPDRQALLAAHPQMAGDLNACLDALELMHCFAPKPGEVKGHRTSPPDRAGRESAGEVSRLAKVGNFRLLREIGRGGMGVVYEAQQTDLKRRVALKILPFAAMLDRRQLTRFKNEAQAAAGLHHTNIVPVYSFGCQDGVYYYAMQYIEGQTLAEVIAGFPDRTVSLPESPQRPFASGEGAIATESMELPHVRPSAASPEKQEGVAEHDSQPASRDATPPWLNDSSWKSVGWCRRVAEMGIQVAEALEHAHQQGILHRDVKPGNLLLDVEGNVWVTDFGLAQIEAGTKLTLTGDVLGTLRYMSPEQAGGGSGRVDCRSDVYSLGITLYELLTLQPAFSHQRRELLLAQVLSEDSPPPPSRLNRAMPRDLETIVQKAAAKVPAERYETAADLADDLRRFLAGRPIRARRPSPLDRLAKWTRRHAPIAVATAAFVAVLAVSLLLLSIRHAAREQEARVEAEEARRDSEAARIDAESAQMGAESARVAAEKVTGYLVDAFRSPDPERDGRTITVAEVLDRTVQELEGQFADQPLIKASLLDALGQSYHGLGLYRQSESLYEEALELRQQVLGREHPDTLTSMTHLAVIHNSLGRYEDAIQLNDRTLQLRRKHLGPHHPDTFISMFHLAVAYGNVRRYGQAISLLERTLRLQHEHLGPAHPANVKVMSHLARCYDAVSLHDEAVKLHEESLALAEMQLGMDHPTMHLAMSGLAASHRSAHRHSQAIPLFEETLRLQRESLSPEHPHAIDSLDNLGVAYVWVGRHEEGVRLLEDALRLRRTHSGWEHPSTLNCMHSLAAGYCVSGRHDEGIALYEETIRLRREHLGIEHLDTLISMFRLAGTYERAGRYGEAIPWYEELLRLAREHRGVVHPDTRMIEECLSHAYRESGTRRDEYLRLREGIFQFRREHLGMADQETLAAMYALVFAYSSAGRHDDAVRVSQTRLDLTRKHLGLDSRETESAARQHGLLLRRFGRHDQAIRVHQGMLDLSREALGGEHPQTRNFIGHLAATYRSTGKYDEAIRLYHASLDQASQDAGPAHLSTLGTMKVLAGTYSDAGRRDESIRLEEEILSQHRHRSGGIASFGLLKQMRGVANRYQHDGQHDRAIRLYEEMIDLCRAQLSPEHVHVLSTSELNYWRVLTRHAMKGLGISYRAVGRYAEAIQTHEELLKLCHDHAGPEAEPTFESMHALAYTYDAAGRHDDAIELYKAILQLRRKHHGLEHSYTLNAIECLAELYASAGCYSEASRLLEERVGYERTRNRHDQLRRTLGRLTDYLLADERYAEAEVHARENLAMCQRQIGNNPHPNVVWATCQAQVHLGRSLAGQKRFDEAESLLVDGYEGMTATRRTIRPPPDADPKTPTAGEEGPADQTP